MGYGVNISVPTPGMTFITDDGVYVRVIPYGDTAVLNEDDAVEAKWLRPENNTESDWTPLQGPNADGEYSGYIPDAPYGAHPLYVLLNIKVRVDFQGNANVPGDVEGVKGFQYPDPTRKKKKKESRVETSNHRPRRKSKKSAKRAKASSTNSGAGK